MLDENDRSLFGTGQKVRSIKTSTLQSCFRQDVSILCLWSFLVGSVLLYRHGIHRQEMMQKAVLTTQTRKEIMGILDTLTAPGCIVEVGCFKCGTTVEIAAKVPDRTVYALDAFGGEGAMEVFKGVDFGDVQADTAPFPNIKLVRGNICETVKTINEPIALILIDCDETAPCAVALDHLIPQLSEGGKILVDDFDWHSIRDCTDVQLKNFTIERTPSGLAVTGK